MKSAYTTTQPGDEEGRMILKDHNDEQWQVTAPTSGDSPMTSSAKALKSAQLLEKGRRPLLL
jgi:hypothetical protein